MPLHRVWIVACALLSASLLAACATPEPPEPQAVLTDPNGARLKPWPATRVEPLAETLHGVTVADPWRWLEDASSPEVQAWMQDQDGFTRQQLAALPGRDALAKRFQALFYVDSISAPTRRGDRLFYTRRHADREKAITYWRPLQGTEAEERVLLDPNTLSPDGSLSVGEITVSWDGRRVAYQEKPNNADESNLVIMDVDSGERLETLVGAKYATPRWTPDGSGFYYVFLPDEPGVDVSDRPGTAEVRFHKVGTPQAADALIYARTGNPQTFLGVGLSRDGRWLRIDIWHGWNRSDVYLRDLQAPGAPGWTTLVEGQDALYDVQLWKDRLIILTNEGAPSWRVFTADARKPARADWTELVPEQKGEVIDGLDIVGGRLAITRLKDATSALEIRELDGSFVRTLELPTVGASFGLTGNPEDDAAWFSFQSFTVPPRIYQTSIQTGATALWSEVSVPIDPSPFAVEQVRYPSKDGTLVSMFIVRRKDAPRDGRSPLLLYGYGGFSLSLRPTFRASIYPWLEAGGSYAVPNLRGGGEYGESWHKAGMLDQKQNVFDDFIAAAEYLIREGYTASDRLAIQGGSNGGLLVGAAMTQRPDLFRAVICAVPLLDMVRYHRFGSGKTWIPEYGSAEDPAQFKTLLAYSPYHRVTPGAAYPALLMLAADSDDRVDPMHARKFTAAVQAATSSPYPALLRVEQNAGHGGGDMLKKSVLENVDVFSFLMAELMRPGQE
jgi:prolyl oligopeptidase